MPDEGSTIHVCAGPPGCPLPEGSTSDDYVRNQMIGCVWCRRIHIDSDGREWEEGPAHA